MKKYPRIFLTLLLFSSIVYATEDNSNLWYPDPNIHNIQLVELYTFNGLSKNLKTDREIKILVNHGYAVGYSEELKVPLYAVYRVRYKNIQLIEIMISWYHLIVAKSRSYDKLCTWKIQRIKKLLTNG